MLDETCREAISKLNSVPFDLNSYINEVLDLESIIDQELVQFFMKMFCPIPEEERQQLSTNIWEKNFFLYCKTRKSNLKLNLFIIC